MKLYFAPGACSLSPHIALREAGLAFDLEKVDLKAKTLADGSDYRPINPKGQVPVLQLDDGSLLTEGPAIVQYIADQTPATALAPAAGTMARYRLMEWLNYLTAEVHKTFSILFSPIMPDEAKAIARTNLATRFDFISARLGQQQYLMGDAFTVADGYLFTLLSWTRPTKIDLAPWPNLVAYQARVLTRPAVHAAMVAEGLVKH